MENNLSPDMSESHNVTRETSVSLMDIWLLIRKQRGFVLSSIIIISIHHFKEHSKTTHFITILQINNFL